MNDELLSPEAAHTEQFEYIQKKLRERGATVSASTFVSNVTIFWKINAREGYGLAGTCTFNATTGDLLKFPGGDWMYVGTCSGNQFFNGSNRPITVACSLEYKAANDSLTWSIHEITATYAGLLNPASPIQYRVDATGSPEVIVVRSFMQFGSHNLHNGSYTTFGST
jgi:hypothetical protein